MFISSRFDCPPSAADAGECARERAGLALQFSLIFYDSYLILRPYTLLRF